MGMCWVILLGDPVGFVDPTGLIGFAEIGVGIVLVKAGRDWYSALSTMEDAAEKAKICQNIELQIDYSFSQAKNTCSDEGDKQRIMNQMIEAQKKLRKRSFGQVGGTSL